MDLDLVLSGTLGYVMTALALEFLEDFVFWEWNISNSSILGFVISYTSIELSPHWSPYYYPVKHFGYLGFLKIFRVFKRIKKKETMPNPQEKRVQAGEVEKAHDVSTLRNTECKKALSIFPVSFFLLSSLQVLFLFMHHSILFPNIQTGFVSSRYYSSWHPNYRVKTWIYPSHPIPSIPLPPRMWHGGISPYWWRRTW